MTARPVFLLTDFGLSDPWVGIMKAVIINISPASMLIDLTHLVSPQNVIQGALVLQDSWKWLPVGAVLCAVVDPGVGTSRRAIAGCVQGKFVVGPDNGLLAPVLDAAENFELVEIRDCALIDRARSATFHGRDVFAPAAGLLARGEEIGALGENVTRYQKLPLPEPKQVSDNVVDLTILAADHFGNLVLNLSRDEAESEFPWIASEDVVVRAGDVLIAGVRRTFADAPVGEAVVYWNSAGRLEIAVNQGSARRVLGLGPGDVVMVERKK